MKKRTLLAVTAALVGSVHSAPIAAQDKQNAILQSAELFAKSSAYFNPKISPDGKHLAFESSIDGKDALCSRAVCCASQVTSKWVIIIGSIMNVLSHPKNI
ncbi:hypothetical protein [Vibrio jasicida]|uniref:hypothetical protein n=1 Tax=Vibrio jasicida TaxID=766224 RepID=UPI0021575390|nr:hypothetical protein [Vibrio jasicida]